MLYLRAPWWRLPYVPMAAWSALVALLVIPLAVMIDRGRRWAFRVSMALGIAWSAFAVLASVWGRNTGLGYYSVLLSGYWVLIYYVLRGELERSFLDPRVQWYQGAPRPVPGLSCVVLSGEGQGQDQELRVSRLDEDGVFLFGGSAALEKKSPMNLRLRYRGKELPCRGVPVAVLEGAAQGRAAAKGGVGFQFEGMSPDARKRLGDFVEELRGEGHV